MMEKEESISLDAVFKKIEENAKNNKPSKVGEENNESEYVQTKDEKEQSKLLHSPKQGFAVSLERIKGLRLEHKTKMEIGTNTNRKVMMLSKILGVNGYALVDVAVNEFIERHKREIDGLVMGMMK